MCGEQRTRLVLHHRIGTYAAAAAAAVSPLLLLLVNVDLIGYCDDDVIIG